MNVLAPDHFRANLVKTLRDKGVLHTPRVETAFLQVPREMFVPAFFCPRANDQPYGLARNHNSRAELPGTGLSG
jgi:protein-L-isoaspartate O-methyltransferase